MLNPRIPAMRNQALIGLGLFALSVLAAWQVGNEVAHSDFRGLMFVALGGGAVVAALAILRRWRTGFYLFLVWLLFEDLARKYMGNNLALFFGKDALAGLVYLALYRGIRRGREKAFRPPFLFFLSIFVWLGVLHVFNQNSPSILYGLLGFKIYFYYVPLLFAGYALIRTEEDLRKFLVANASLAGVIGALGIVQGIMGNTFLNPGKLAPELADLGNLSKTSPISGQVFSLPDSVFVSSGRYGQYLIVVFTLVMGTAAYLLFYTRRNRRLVFAVIGLLGAATLLCGSRGVLLSVMGSAVVLSTAFLWGAPWRQRQVHKTLKAIGRSVVAAALALTAIILLYPQRAGPRLAFYTETLSPSSPAYELGIRSWDYPISNFLDAFKQPNWLIGNGIGTASLGVQYVAKLLGSPSLGLGVEEGYGQLVIEMGIVAPILWILWTAALLYYSGKAVYHLRGTRLFPVAFAILWFAFILLYPFTYAGLAAYENYICNAYLWLLTGILFRLPALLATTAVPVPWHGSDGR
jgi:hypothetical protein